MDASGDAIGYALGQIQNGREVALAYGGRNLNSAEKNYSTTEREALAMVESIKRFEPYLVGRRFRVHSDHDSLKWLMSVKRPSGRLSRWSLLLQQYDFDIIYRPGKQNGNADALSRRYYKEEPVLNSLTSCDFPCDTIRTQQRKDSNLADLIDYLETNTLPGSDSSARSILLDHDNYLLDENGILFHLWKPARRGRKEIRKQLVIPHSLRYEILVNAHDYVTSGHMGITRTYEKMRDRYYWKGLYADVEHWCKSCQDCAMRKPPRNRRQIPLLPIPVESAFSRVAIDVLGPLRPTKAGNRYIVVFSDYTRYPEAFAVETADAATVANLLVTEVICRHGVPRTILTDRGSNFQSAVFKEVCRIVGSTKLNTTSYRPQCDGLVERLNDSLATILSIYISRDQTNWDEVLPYALFSYMVSTSEVTGDSPFFLLYAREPILPCETCLLAPKNLVESVETYKQRLVQNLEIAQEMGRFLAQRSQLKFKDFHDRNATNPPYEIGNRVWVFFPRVPKGLSKKLRHRWNGPYRIIEKLSPVHFSLKARNDRRISTIVHAQRLKPYYDPNSRPILPLEQDPDENGIDFIEDDLPPDSYDNISDQETGTTPVPSGGTTASANSDSMATEQSTSQAQSEAPPIVIDNKDVFAVEKLLKKRVKNGRTEYYVKWLNYSPPPPKDCTWEAEENIYDPNLIQEFNARASLSQIARE